MRWRPLGPAHAVPYPHKHVPALHYGSAPTPSPLPGAPARLRRASSAPGLILLKINPSFSQPPVEVALSAYNPDLSSSGQAEGSRGNLPLWLPVLTSNDTVQNAIVRELTAAARVWRGAAPRARTPPV